MSEKQKTTQLKEYPYAEAVATAKEYFAGDELAATVWVSKYALKDSFGHIYEASPEQMHWRIANEIARIENRYTNPMSAEEVFYLLDHFRYVIPQGGPMTGIGNTLQIASLSNCFVIGHKNPRRLVWRYYPHRRGAGPADETSRWRRSRPLAPASHG